MGKSFSDWTRDIANSNNPVVQERRVAPPRTCEHLVVVWNEAMPAIGRCNLCGMTMARHDDSGVRESATNRFIALQLKDLGARYDDSGNWFYDCRVCQRETIINDPAEFDPLMHYCGRSPGCLP